MFNYIFDILNALTSVLLLLAYRIHKPKTSFSVLHSSVLHTSSRGQQCAHLESYITLLAAETGQHEEDKGEEARERDGYHCQG